MLQTVPGTMANDRTAAAWPRESRGPAFDPFDALTACESRMDFRRGQEIFAEHDAARFCYRLQDGNVRLVKLMADGRRQICEFLGAGDFFGFETGHVHYFSAEAMGDVTVTRYPRRAVDTLITEEKDFARHVQNVTAQNLQGAYQRMVLLCHKSAQERMAWFLLDLADRSEDNDTVCLPMTRGDIANYLGMAIETVSRVLRQFKDMSAIVQKSMYRIHILDRDVLEMARGDI